MTMELRGWRLHFVLYEAPRFGDQVDAPGLDGVFVLAIVSTFAFCIGRAAKAPSPSKKYNHSRQILYRACSGATITASSIRGMRQEKGIIFTTRPGGRSPAVDLAKRSWRRLRLVSTAVPLSRRRLALWCEAPAPAMAQTQVLFASLLTPHAMITGFRRDRRWLWLSRLRPL